jgi:membrane protein
MAPQPSAEPSPSSSTRGLLSTLEQTYQDWSDHQGPRLGAALAFYTILSLAPLVTLLIAGVGLILGHSAAQEDVISKVREMIGTDGANSVRAIIQNANQPAPGIVASLVGLITLLFGASGVFGELHSGLNIIWDAEPKERNGLRGLIIDRFVSFGMVLAVGFLLLVSLLLSAALAAVGKFFAGSLPIAEPALSLMNVAFSFAGICCLFALIFRYIPETEISWNEVWPGAFATAVLFTAGKYLLGLYLGKAGVGSMYGAAGSLVVVLVWVYYSAMLFFLGAEFTHVRARGSGRSA